MTRPASISMDKFLETTQDFNFLKDQGIKYIESIASQLWTDYNTHDPGITILDMLCYAITELAARTQLPISELIAESPDHSFLTARRILPNKVLTGQDYRKLLIDHPDIRDGNVLPALTSEVTLYYQTAPHALSFAPTPVRLQLSGLLNNRLELPGILNEDWIADEVDLGNGRRLTIHFNFDPYESAAPVWLNAAGLSTVSIVDPIQQPVGVEDESGNCFYAYFLELDIAFTSGAPLDNKATWILLKEPLPKTDTAAHDLIRAHLSNRLTTIDEQNPIRQYQLRLKEVQQALDRIRFLPQANRNLCEDWFQVIGYGIQKVGIRIEELEIIPEVDREEVVGRIYFEIDQFLAPFIKPQSLEEAQAEDLLPEQIYEGPLLERGFLTDQHIASLERDGNIYTSDLLALIMNVEVRGRKPVIGVRGLEIVSYINRYEVAKKVVNCLRPRDLATYKLRFSGFHSKVKVKQEGVAAGMDGADLGLAHFQSLKSAYEQFTPPGTADIPVVKGQKRSVGQYYSIQHDLPAKYKLRTGAITAEDGPLRAAQAEQLRAYLLFFEQLLANYCSQLANLEQVFSSDPAVAQTYFFQPLHMIPHVGNIIPDFPDYENYLGQINEPHSTFLQRRNQMIDHLLARFGEQFAEYAAKMYQTNSNLQLAQDKLAFLKDYPALSAYRACAFDYCKKKKNGQPDVWDTDNVSGWEKRVAGLLGIPNYKRRHLTTIMDHIEIYDEQDNDGIPEARFRVRLKPLSEDGDSKILLSSSTRYPRNKGLNEELAQVLDYAADRNNYRIFPAKNKTYYFNLVDDTGEVIARRIEPFDTISEAELEITKIIVLIKGRFVEIYDEIDNDGIPEARFRIWAKKNGSSDNKILLSSSTRYPYGNKLQEELDRVFIFATNRSNYEIFPAVNETFYFNLLDDTGEVIARRIEPFDTVGEADQEISKLLALFQGRSDEGFHLIEHILLRPRNKSYPLLPVPEFNLGLDNAAWYIKDPYSAQLTIVLPTFAGRFRNPGFRLLVEKMMRIELPAHVFPYFIWVENKIHLRAFEESYKQWLNSLCSGKNLRNSTNNLIDWLNQYNKPND